MKGIARRALLKWAAFKQQPRAPMPDYYSMLGRAVAALEINTFEERRGIYNRARSLQSNQLGKRRYKKADFDREHSMLEAAISRVETEATAKRIIVETCSSPPVQPSDIGPTRLRP